MTGRQSLIALEACGRAAAYCRRENASGVLLSSNSSIRAGHTRLFISAMRAAAIPAYAASLATSAGPCSTTSLAIRCERRFGH